MSTTPSPSSLNAWNETDLQRSGFAADGTRSNTAVADAGPPKLLPSAGFADWLAASGGSLIFSTYQSGKLFLLGTDTQGQLYAQDRTVGTAMGLAVSAESLWVGTREQVWRFSNTGAASLKQQDWQAVYMPRTCHMVGDSDLHEVLADVSFRGQHYDFLYANTRYSCIATIDPHYMFRPVWTPSFISDLVAEDRCHLNGIGARDGELRYATFCGRTDTALGWKAQQTGTGFIMDLATETVVCEGLSMPHSPRWHNGKLWVLNSGEGELGYVDFDNRCLVPVARCAGFARGLSFVGNHAVVGLSRLRPRKKVLMGGINLEQNLNDRQVIQRCGLQVFDLDSGKLAHWLTIDGSVTELYDVAFLPEITRPYTPGFREPELHKAQQHLP